MLVKFVAVEYHNDLINPGIIKGVLINAEAFSMVFGDKDNFVPSDLYPAFLSRKTEQASSFDVTVAVGADLKIEFFAAPGADIDQLIVLKRFLAGGMH